MDLDFVRIECEISVDTPSRLAAALYDSLRNFEQHFKASCCPNQQESCPSCSLHIACPYREVFGQRLSYDPEIVRVHQKPSLPFSLYVKEIDDKTSSCTVGVVIVGSAVNYIGFFHTALVHMVEEGVYDVLSHANISLHCFSLDYQDGRHEIIDAASLPESVILLSGRHILQNAVHSDSARIFFISPLRLLSNGFIAHRFDFAIFFRSQLRRISSICAYYGSGELDLDFVSLSRDAQNVAVLEDGIIYTQPPWSKRPNRAGLIGNAKFAGLVEPMFSLLLLGSYLNSGKGASFGSGHYKLEDC